MKALATASMMIKPAAVVVRCAVVVCGEGVRWSRGRPDLQGHITSQRHPPSSSFYSHKLKIASLHSAHSVGLRDEPVVRDLTEKRPLTRGLYRVVDHPRIGVFALLFAAVGF